MKKQLRNSLWMTLALATGLTSCNHDDNVLQQSGNGTEMHELKTPPGFGFNNLHDLRLNLTFSTLNNDDLSGIRFQLADKPLDLGGRVLFTGLSVQNGEFSGQVSLPKHLSEVVLITYSLGLTQNQVITLPADGSPINLLIGGTNPSPLIGYEEKYPNAYASIQQANNLRTQSSYANKLSFKLGTYTNEGKPNYLEPTRDAIPDAFMQNINFSLPEMRSVPANNPQYLNESYERNIQITRLSDVFVTFVTEGAGFRNTLMYYVYDQGNAPRTLADIDSFYMVFPNASLQNSGGMMRPGEKVKIGRFPANKSIGFALVANGWRGGAGNGINANNWIFLTDKHLNPEASPSLKQHTILLWDVTTQRYVLGFEDVRRDLGGDQDFNDCVFYVTSNPVNGIDNGNCIPTQNPRDRDRDGVPDDQDEYPDDCDRAYNTYTPLSTLAFEDLWPSTGDYDFNDLVVNYVMQQVTNAQNRVVDIKGKFWVKAIGANFLNGLGMELNVPSSAVRSVTGMRYEPNTYVRTQANGTESGNTKASFVIFDNAFPLMRAGSPNYLNTIIGKGRSTSDTVNISLTFNTPQLVSTLGAAPYNPFLIQNRNRSVEIHLPDKAPTMLANRALFGSRNDRSNPAQGVYYRTANHLPWAILLPVDFDHPTEKTPINRAYTRFNDWVLSNGSAYADWYTNRAGYRVSGKIFQ